MKSLTSILASAALFAAASASAQTPRSSSDKWWTYLADYDGKPGSTVVDMGLKPQAPMRALPHVVIAGVKYQPTRDGGLPDPGQLTRLHQLSEPVVAAILSTGPSVHAGSFTHDGEYLHYVYVADVDGVREAFYKALKRACETCEPIYKTRQDADWNAYLKFLYPNQATLDFYRSRSQ